MAIGAVSIVQFASGAALLALAAVLLALTRERAGRLLAVYGALVGAFFLLDGIAVALDAGPDAVASEAVAHVVLAFAWPFLTLFASAVTGIHERFWRRASVRVGALALPIALLTIELALPTPITRYHHGVYIEGAYYGAYALDLMLYTCAFAYTVILLGLALARESDPEAIAGRALLLSAFIVPAARAVREALTGPWRWRFLDDVGLPRPPTLPDGLWPSLALALALSLLPGALLARARSPRAREAGWGGITLATIVSGVIVLGAGGANPVSNVRWVFFALLVTYAALRHRLFGARRVALAAFERPLIAAAFGTLGILFVLSIDVVATDEIAIPAGIGLAVVALALVVATSGSSVRPAPARRYSPERELGRGAQGRVTLALDTLLHRSVVLKRVPGGEDALREARAAARVSHPSLVAVHDVADEPDGPALVMEYVPGGTLEERLRAGPLAPADARRLGTELAEGLQALHDAKLVHGDIKAANVFFRADGRAALGDFGSARVCAEETIASLGREPASASLAGAAPEVLRGEPGGPAADVYGLGALLYRALSGESYLRFPPTFDDARHAILTAPPLLPHARIPPAWERVLAKALEKDPARRYQSARGMRDALASVET